MMDYTKQKNQSNLLLYIMFEITINLSTRVQISPISLLTECKGEKYQCANFIN